MTERVATTDAAAASFLTLADAEGASIPMYARLCRAIAAAPPLASLLLEAPAGRIENGDDPASTAARELEEEAGYSAGSIESLGSILVAPGYTTERIHLYLATDLTPVPPRPDEDERIEVVKMPFEEALARIDGGEIDDAKTIVALLRTAARRP